MARALKKSRKAFTLVELLVVIGIIAVLISILLPSLSAARRAANRAACAANLRTIATAMFLYTTEGKGAIPGNAWTSGAFLKATGGPTYSDTNCPTVCQTWDWTAPLAISLGIKFELGGNLLERSRRFLFLCSYPAFQCPENDGIAPPYGSSPIKVTAKQVSFVTSSLFQYRFGSGEVSKYQSFVDTGEYFPNLNRIGQSSEKIFMSDGARFTNADNMTPDYNLGWDNAGTSPGGQYADYGPWSSFSRAFLRKTPITFSMRHGNRKAGVSLGSYRFNAVFFDGHVESLDGATGMNPNFWMPKGTHLASSECTDEAIQMYFGGASVLNIR